MCKSRSQGQAARPASNPAVRMATSNSAIFRAYGVGASKLLPPDEVAQEGFKEKRVVG
jgi:hypothetical protein